MQAEQQHAGPDSSTGTRTSYIEAPVTFAGPEGFPLAAVLCEPAPCEPAPRSRTPFRAHQCALLCHGFGSHKDGFHFPAIARHLAQHLGMSSLRLDFTGNKDSPGPFRFASFDKEVQQIAAAKQFLEQQHGKQVVLLLGHSRGAINATLYSGQQIQQQPQQQPQQQQQQEQERQQQQGAPSSDAAGAAVSSRTIPLVVLVAGRYDLRINMYQRYGKNVLQELQQTGPWQQVCKRDGDRHPIAWTLTAEDLQARFAYDIPAACAAIGQLQPPDARPQVLVVHGASDPICEASDSASLARAIAGAQLAHVEGADHWFKGRQRELLRVVEDFALAAGRRAGLCDG